MIPPEFNTHIIQFEELTLAKEIGIGSFGQVWKAIWRGQNVAVKRLREDMISTRSDSGNDEFQSFLNEALLMMKIKPHKNVISLFAICLHPFSIVIEYVEKGSLGALMEKQKLSPKQKLQLMKDIALGMYHLACEKIVHKDLATRNVLIASDGTAKIADFGLARSYDEKHYSKSDAGLPLRWMSPESLNKRVYSEKSDVWSFATTCIELLTQQKPYPDMEPIVVARYVMNGELYPTAPEGTNPIISRMILQCGTFEPDDRLTFQEIVKTLARVLA